MNNIIFEEVIPSVSGINYTGRTWGGAWGDVNGDSYPDLWVNNHGGGLGILYLNQRDGTFRDATAEIFVKKPRGDQHGAAWADFDNDGDQDLVQLVGAALGLGRGPKQFYVNDLGRLEDRASSLGLDYPLARGRSPLWFDFNNDGLLDLVMGAFPRMDKSEAPPKIFQQKADGTFEDASAIAGFALTSAPFFFLSDLSGDGKLDLVARTSPFTVYDITSLPFVDITSATIPGVRYANDVAIADFNGDLLPDLYLTKGAGRGNDLYQNGADKAVVKLLVTRNEQGFRFNCADEVTFNLFPTDWQFSISLNEVYIGAGGIHPIDWKFTLSPYDPNIQGILPHASGVDRGIYIGYDPNLKRWQLLLSSSDKTILDENIRDTNSLIGFIEATKPISSLNAIGFQADPRPANSQLLINTGQGFIDQSGEAGINSIPVRGSSVVAGDFDNDMDQDIYVVTSRSVLNTPDILYENQGNGTFLAIPNAGGAAGTEIGIGDFVIAADYDLDGFLDLLVANGEGHPNTPLTNDASYQLFRNQGNGNHWLEIDLQGTVSNRDGIGAQVFLTAGDVTQLREQSGGIHTSEQNHQRLHFGLADNRKVQELVINWSSGRKQRVWDITPDQLVRGIEPGGNEKDLIIGQKSNDIISGGGGNDVLEGGEGNDYLYGNEGNDRLVGNTGNDKLLGGGGNDTIFGDLDNDTLNGGTGIDTLIGGTGNDIYVVDSTTDTITELVGEGTDTIKSSVTFSLAALTNIENLTLTGLSAINGTGNTGNNVLTGNSANNTLIGDAGNDTLNGGAGIDTLIGGTGNDIYVVNSTTDTITELAGEGTDTIQSSVTFNLAALTNIESLTLTGLSAINGTGNMGNNVLTGNSANNILTGDAGNDILKGGAGVDTLIGETGNDIYVVDSTTDTITELSGEGTDTIQSSVTFSLAALTNIENLTLTGTATINGTGNTAKNLIVGNSADNTLNGGIGADTLTGGAGSDIFAFQFGQSSVVALDRITDFAINTDKIDLLTQGGLAMAAPSNFTRATDSIATSLANLVTRVFADADGGIAGNQALEVNSAALVRVTTGAIAGTYLVINDITAGFQANNDLLVNITGFTGTLPTFGAIPVNSFFV